MNNLAIFEMSTRNTANLPGRTEKSTTFQLRMGGDTQNLIDFTEHKLVRYAKATVDEQQKATLLELIADYRAGLVAVAWRRGLPVPLRVTKDT